MKRVTLTIAAIATASVLFWASPAGAVDIIDCTGMTQEQCNILKADQLNSEGDNIIWDVVQFIMMALGGIAVIMIIVGGYQYVTSQGDSGAVAKAKNTILYAVIGLIVAILASVIVQFVVKVATQ